MRLESVFLSVRPIVLSLARSTMLSSTTLFSNNRKVQRARPLGGLEQAKAISLASFSPSKILRNRRRRALLAAQHSLEAFFHQLLAHPVDHGCAGLQSLDDLAVTPPFAGFRDIGLQQYPRLQQPLRRAAFLSGSALQAVRVPRRSTAQHISLPRISFAAMIASVARVATKANHQILSNWLKRA